MAGLIRLIVVGFILLTVIYVLVWLYAQSVRRERLEDEWDAEHPDGDPSVRDAFVEKGMADYHSSIRPKLILLVYVVPTLAAGLLVYLINLY